MGNPVDDAFAAADDDEAGRKYEKQLKEKHGTIFDAEINPFVASVLEGVRVRIEQFNGHEQNTNPATIQLERWKIKMRRASSKGMLDRLLRVEYEPYPQSRIKWTYEVLPHASLPYEVVESGEVGFVIGDDDHLHLDGFSPDSFANRTTGRFIREAVDDMVKAQNAGR